MTDAHPSNQALLLTAPGTGAIAVVRLVGPAVPEFLARHFSKPVYVGRCVHGLLRDSAGQVVDDPVAARVSEQVVDLNVHGGPWIVHQTLELARRNGFAVQAPLGDILSSAAVDPWPDTSSPGAPPEDGGEDFPWNEPRLSRAVLTHLPLARTELAVRALLAQPQAWTVWQALPAQQRRPQAQVILEDQALYWLLHPPQVALVGPPNAGKSTLANQLFAQDRSIVADQPGTTRDWVGELANINDLAVMLVDTPGRRDSEDLIEQAAIRQSDAVIRQADLVLLVLDASQPDQRNTGAWDEAIGGLPAIRVANKQDRCLWAPGLDTLPITATTGQGLDLLRRRIARYFGCDALDPARPRWWTREQQMSLRSLS